MNETELTLVIATVVAALVQVGKRWLEPKYLRILGIAVGAVAVGVGQGIAGGGPDLATVIQVVLGALLPAGVHGAVLRDNRLGKMLQGE